jgi:hypothetical protein
MEVKILPNCTEVENGVNKEMIRLFGAIMDTCSFAGMNSK